MKMNFNDYNSAPEELKIIPVSEWRDGMFHYCTGPKESRQVRNDPDRFCFNLIMFDVPNFDNKKLGYAVMMDWWDNHRKRNRKRTVTRFCRYGKEEDWRVFREKFAAQFARDNS